LRLIGQSKNCCPPDFYTNQIFSANESYPFIKNKIINDDVISRELDIHNYMKLPKDVELKNKDKFHYGKCEMDVTIEEYLEFYNSKRADKYKWSHSKFDIQIFKKYLYYQHCDLRKQIIHRRITNDEYIIDNNENNNTVEKKKKNDDGYKHEKVIWFESQLPYVKFDETLNWDPMHVLKNTADRIYDIWMGERFKNEKIKTFCSNIEVHPNYYNNTGTIPWEFKSKKDIDLVFFHDIKLCYFI
jgi:hypothetical protein